MENTAEVEMPKYKCHKEVHAIKIKSVIEIAGKAGIRRIVPEDERYDCFDVPEGWMDRFKGGGEGDSGYYVVYEDGYTSWSPSKVFEEGYEKI